MSAAMTPETMIGTFRRFGLAGPVYEVTGVASVGQDGDVLMRIHVPTTDEDTEYPYSCTLEDLKEA